LCWLVVIEHLNITVIVKQLQALSFDKIYRNDVISGYKPLKRRRQNK